MSKLDILRRGFADDEEVEVNVKSYGWHIKPVSEKELYKANRLSSRYKSVNIIPLLRFDLWLSIYKQVDIETISWSGILDSYFEEYKLFYCYANEQGLLKKRLSDFALEKFFNKSISMLASNNANITKKADNVINFMIDKMSKADVEITSSSKYASISSAMVGKWEEYV